MGARVQVLNARETPFHLRVTSFSHFCFKPCVDTCNIIEKEDYNETDDRTASH